MKKIQEINDVCKEVILILAFFNDDLIKKIPTKVLKNLNELAAESKSNFYIDTKNDLEKQNISEESKDLISLIYYNFIADENEKNQLLEKWNENEIKYQEKLKETYNIDNMFQNRMKEISKVEKKSLSDTAMIEYKKETIFYKIKKLIKNILKPIK